MTPDLFSSLPADQAQRDAALDITKSVIVQAPAGSGKTDLLTRRFLKLLAVVNEPEDILAITFTRAATAEMRSRILADLETAAGLRAHEPDNSAERFSLAHAALEHAERRGWRILEQPHRLIIETIDSLCLRIAHDQPLLARLGGRLQPTEHAAPLYAQAARRTIGALGGQNQMLSEAIAHLLRLRDNNLPNCESLVAEMLARRDQWQHAFPLAGTIDWDLVRSQLELPFRREVQRVLHRAHELLTAEPLLADELMTLARYACGNPNDIDIALLDAMRNLPQAAEGAVEHWRCLCNLLLTADDEWRAQINKRYGFPAGESRRADSPERLLIARMKNLISRLEQTPGLLDTLRAIRRLPPAHYSEEQWDTLQQLFTVLRHAVAELRVLFAEQGAVDFTEISLAALQVLKHSDPDRLLALSGNLRHLLVDEFQDTSRRQHELISALLTAWESGDARTCFLVGDPMQSIYMFRQAEVELFTQVRERGMGAEGNLISCESVQLSVNFRSHAGLVDPLNELFGSVFSGDAAPGAAAVPFSPSQASAEAALDQSVSVYPQILGSAEEKATEEECREAEENEAKQALAIIERHLPAIEQARISGGEYRVAVLVRTRSHLARIAPLLRQRQIPFRAVEIESLADRQELRDLLSLTRVLLHPMDRVAWLSVLRAPWCGLTLDDLLLLTGNDDPQWRHTPMPELIERHLPLLSREGQRRAGRTMDAMKQALWLRWRQSQSPSFASWIERTWRTLGGPACIDAAAHENVQVFFSRLDTVAPDGMEFLSGDFEAELKRLFAQPDPEVSERCGVQLMTIHKAKGLGFEVVIVPALERSSGTDSQSLIVSLERIGPHTGEDEFLVAPIGLKGEDTHPLYRWVRNQRKLRFDEERRRLFYVACTRARRELHLFGTATVTNSGLRSGAADSLLNAAWAGLESEFADAWQKKQSQKQTADNILPFPVPAEKPVDLAAAVERPRLTLRRLPIDAALPRPQPNVITTGANDAAPSEDPSFRRPEGSRIARATGDAVHVLLQRLGSQLAIGQPNAGLIRKHAAALLRSAALSGDALQSVTDTVTNTILACAGDPEGRWILSPHPEAQSEASWTGLVDGTLRTLRADRVFRAGAEPIAGGSEYLWIIDYKTAFEQDRDKDAFLKRERRIYAPQLYAYARALRSLHGKDTKLRLGLYYPRMTGPRMASLDWWDPEEAIQA